MGGLPAGCRAPIAALARMEETHRMVLTGLVASLDGRTVLTDRVSGPVSDEAAARALGERLAAMLAAGGAERVLMAARSAVYDAAP